jgi:anti-anti-sigma factor
MNLTVISDDNSVVHVQCAGKISQEDFPDGTEPLEALLGSHGGFGRKVLLNLERATFIDSSGISWLLICHKHCLQQGGCLVVHSVPPLIDQVIQLVKLPRVMHFAADAASARTSALGAAK